ncbi:MAG: glycosyltransferase family 39 protein [Patescibacteria group bacterium]
MLNKKIFLIFILAFLIRLIALNQSLWLDEAVTANVVKNFDLTQIISKFSPTDFHPPLYYLFMKLWTNFFGYSEIALRMPSVLFSLMTGYVVYLIGGIWSAIFFLFNPLIVYYSQEARMYMMTMFFLTVVLYHFLFISKNLDSRLRGNDIWFNLFIFLSLLTFYGSVFLITAFLIYFLYKKQYKNLFICLLVVFVYLLIISPLLYQQLINSKIALANVTNWSLVLGKANLKDLLLIPVKFSIGRISFYPKWLYWGMAGIWIGFVMLTIKTVLNKTVFIKTVLYLLIFPLVLGFLISFFVPMLQYFRFIYLIPIVSLLLSFRLSSQASSNLRGSILVGGFLFFSLVYLLLPQFHREDWKSLVKSLPKDKTVYMIMASSDPVKYYSRNLKIKDLTLLRPMGYGGQREIIVIPYTTEIYGLDYKSSLIKAGYQLKKEVSFREVTYERWVK